MKEIKWNIGHFLIGSIIEIQSTGEPFVAKVINFGRNSPTNFLVEIERINPIENPEGHVNNWFAISHTTRIIERGNGIGYDEWEEQNGDDTIRSGNQLCFSPKGSVSITTMGPFYAYVLSKVKPGHLLQIEDLINELCSQSFVNRSDYFANIFYPYGQTKRVRRWVDQNINRFLCNLVKEEKLVSEEYAKTYERDFDEGFSFDHPNDLKEVYISGHLNYVRINHETGEEEDGFVCPRCNGSVVQNFGSGVLCDPCKTEDHREAEYNYENPT